MANTRIPRSALAQPRAGSQTRGRASGMSAVRGRAGAHVRGDGNPLTDSFARQGGGLQSGAGPLRAAPGRTWRRAGWARSNRNSWTRGMRRLGLSPRTLEGYRVSGGGPDFHRFGNRVRYRRRDLDAWAAQRRARRHGSAASSTWHKTPCIEQRHQETYWKTARSHASSLQTAEVELAALVASYRDKHPGFLAGKQCGARCLHLARCSPQAYANLERHRATDPARTQAAHLQSQGLSEPRLVGAPLNRSPHRRKMGNRNQDQMGTAR